MFQDDPNKTVDQFLEKSKFDGRQSLEWQKKTNEKLKSARGKLQSQKKKESEGLPNTRDKKVFNKDLRQEIGMVSGSEIEGYIVELGKAIKNKEFDTYSQSTTEKEFTAETLQSLEQMRKMEEQIDLAQLEQAAQESSFYN